MWVYDEHGLLHRKTALDSGVSPRELEAALEDGRLVRVQKGVYIAGSRLDGLPDYRKRLVKYRYAGLAAAGGGDSRPLSHQSAAAMHGLDLLLPDLRRVHLTSGKSGGGAMKGRTIAVHPGKIADGDVVVIDGVRVTSLARTAVDVALRVDFPRALAVFDVAPEGRR